MRKEDQEDVKIFDVPYINGYVEKQAKPVNEDSLCYEALDSREQRVARLLGPTLRTLVTLGHS